jgi:hypothetical protein
MDAFAYMKIDSDINQVTTMILVCASFFLAVGYLLIFQARQKIKLWHKYEQMTSDYDLLAKLKQDYHAQYYKYQAKPVGQKKLIDQIQYFLTRLSFINPVYLPPLSECYLRKDFNFAYYLGLSYAKTLEKFFTNSSVSIFIALIGASLFRVADLRDIEAFQSVFVSAVFVVFYMGIQVLMNKILVSLQPEVDKVEQMNFDQEFDSIDPFEMFDNFKKPAYLNNETGASSIE